MKKFNQVVRMRAEVLPFWTGRRSYELVAHMMCATAGRDNDVFERGEVSDEQFLRRAESDSQPLFAIGCAQQV
jgi:hypothetical protein